MAGSRGVARRKAPRKAGLESSGQEVEGGSARTVTSPPAGASPRTSVPSRGGAGGFRARVEEGLTFLRSVQAESRRVSWPGRREVQGATVVVLLTLFLVAGYMGAVDWALQKLLGLKYTGF